MVNFFLTFKPINLQISVIGLTRSLVSI